jgi:CheY-like chemotaxis protein
LEHEKDQNSFLIVENDPNDAFLIARALTSIPFCRGATVCRNPSEAKAYLLGAGMYANRTAYPMPSVVITDLRMGDESGIELVEWMRDQENPIRDLAVVILSGSASPSQMDAASKVGAQRVLSKPGKLEELRLVLQAIANEYCKPTGNPVSGL